MTGPDKNKLFPNERIKTICYLKNLPPKTNVEIGEYTYYSDNKNPPEKFYDNIEHHYEFLGDKLIIGRFCAIAEGIKFIMNGANHKMDGIQPKTRGQVHCFALDKTSDLSSCLSS